MVLFDHGLKIALASIKGSIIHRGKPPTDPKCNPLNGKPRAPGAKAYAGYNPMRPRDNGGRRRELDVLASHSEESGVEWLTLAVKPLATANIRFYHLLRPREGAAIHTRARRTATEPANGQGGWKRALAHWRGEGNIPQRHYIYFHRPAGPSQAVITSAATRRPTTGPTDGRSGWNHALAHRQEGQPRHNSFTSTTAMKRSWPAAERTAENTEVDPISKNRNRDH